MENGKDALMTRKMRELSVVVSICGLALAELLTVLWSPPISHAAGNGVLLTGTIKSASGENMEGVTVSAKIEGRTITTSVFTDKEGHYYFPPMQDGNYRVWGQAVGYEKVQGEVDLKGTVQHKDFVMKQTKDFFLQLSGDQMVAALPEDTRNHRRMKDVFARNCTSCHEANVALQNRFDEQGWEAIIYAMSRIEGMGNFRGEDQAAPIIAHYKDDLAKYLTEMRGPGPSPMQVTLPPCPSGDAVLPVIYEYDLPMETGGYSFNNGSDWSRGPAMASGGAFGGHDAQVDWNGDIWFTYNQGGSVNRTIGKVDGRTGEVTNFKYAAPDGLAALSHGITMAHDGVIWFTVTIGGPVSLALQDESGVAGVLGRIDPKTEKIEVFRPPTGMAGIRLTVDEDGQGKIWASTMKGALRFDPKTITFTEFKSATLPGPSYGVTGDREGNGWWAQIGIDIVGHSNIENGKSSEIKLPPNTNGFLREGDLSPEDLRAYGPQGAGAQRPRRLGADRTGDDVWVPDYSGQNLLRINVPTLKTTYYPAPLPALNPYMAVVDNDHNVWINLQNSDSIARFDPKTTKWTLYNWPSRGTQTRALHIMHRDGVLQFSGLSVDGGRVARMVIRTHADLQALRLQTQAKDVARGQ
jgi:streptogramin lyase